MSAKYDRQIGIVNYLTKCGRTTLARLAYALEINIHTVKRDIADLAYHFPIDTYQGKYGGVEMNAAFVLNRSMVTTEQLNVLRAALLFYCDATHDSRALELCQTIFPKQKF